MNPRLGRTSTTESECVRSARASALYAAFVLFR